MRTTLRTAMKKIVTIASAVALLAALAACSSSSGHSTAGSSGGSSSGGSSGGSSSGGDSAAAAAAAHKVVDTALKPQAVSVNTPLKHPPTKGKLAYLIRINLEGTAEFAEWKNILAQVGWTGRDLAVDPTDPQGFSNAIKQAVSARANYITVHGQSVAAMKPGMDAARAAGIPVFFFNGNDFPQGKKNWVFGNISTLNGILHDVSLPLNWDIADSNGTADVLWVGYSDLPILALAEPRGRAAFEKACPMCKYQLLDLSTDQLNNGDAPNLIVNEIRKNPKIKYVATQVSFAFTGLRQALDSAGLNDVKLGIASAPTQWLDALRKGDVQAITEYPTGEALYACLDQLLRYDEGMDVQQHAHDSSPVQLYDKASVGDTKTYQGPAGYQQTYLKLWGVSAPGVAALN